MVKAFAFTSEASPKNMMFTAPKIRSRSKIVCGKRIVTIQKVQPSIQRPTFLYAPIF